MKPHDCPELDDLPCALCERAINAAESERYSPTGYDDGMAEREADRYQRWLDGMWER